MKSITRIGWATACSLALGLTLECAPVAAGTSDAWITTKSKMALLTTEGVSGTAINVDTIDGQVTLHGKVASTDEKTKAERTVGAIQGVKGIRNLLQVVAPSRQGAVKASDTQIKEQVAKALKNDPALSKDSVSVSSVNSGVVLLIGEVKTLSDHLRAIDVAARVPGVRRVSSEIKSPDQLADAEIYRERDAKAGATGTASPVRDAWITTAVKMRLIADERTPALSVNVDTTGNTVTLFGMVPTSEAKVAAAEDARKVDGVKSVVNALEVVPEARQDQVKAADSDVAKLVEDKLSQDDTLRDTSITVDVQNGVARLTGKVGSAEQRLRAAVTARMANGVRAVKDDLQIASN